MNVLLTGGAGFIGSHIVDQLIIMGAKVKVLDNMATGNKENINNKADLVIGDISDSDLFKKVVENCDTIFHLAAFTSVPESFSKESKCREINEIAFKNILSVAAVKNVKKIIFSSSSAVYPDDSLGPFNEQSKVAPSSPYGKSKLYGESLLKQWCKENGDKVGTALRYFNVYGPRQEADSDYASVIPKFMSRIRNDEPIAIYGDGSQTRDYIYVSDIVTANIKGLESLGFNKYAVGTGVEYSVNKLVAEISKLTNKKVKISSKPLPKGDALRSSADSSVLKETGWNSEIGIKKGLASTWKYFNN
jgi:UDP-glucose 4-epimerase